MRHHLRRQRGQHNYDAADRLTDTGVTYDAFGRTTKIPAALAGGADLTTDYYANDLVRRQSQGDQANTYNLDPARREHTKTITGTTTVSSLDLLARTETSHYADDSDAPAWIDLGNGAQERYIEGIDGDLAAEHHTIAGVRLQLTNLHGDVVATASLNPALNKPLEPSKPTNTASPASPASDGTPGLEESSAPPNYPAASSRWAFAAISRS